MQPHRYALIIFLFLSLNATAEAADVTLHHSPNQGVQATIISHIDAAEKNICVAAYSFTSKPIADALLRAVNRDVPVYLIVDRRQPTARHGQTPRLATHGITTAVDRHHSLMHQKTIIIDQKILICGSYNFSANAEHRNSEILVIITDKKIATQATKHFTTEFSRCQPYAGPQSATPNTKNCPTCR